MEINANINLEYLLEKDDAGFSQFMENMKSWKKELSPVDIADAFDKLLKDTDAPVEKYIEMNLVCNAIIMILFPVEEYKEKFVKGEK